MTTFLGSSDAIDVRPVMTLQADAEPGSLPRGVHPLSEKLQQFSRRKDLISNGTEFNDLIY